MDFISLEYQHRLWTEYVATMTTLNGLLWIDHINDERKYNFYKHQIMSFREWLWVQTNHPNADNSIGQYSFLENRHIDLRGKDLESFDQFYKSA